MAEDPSRNTQEPYPWLLGAVTFSDAGRRKFKPLALPTQGLLFTSMASQSAMIWADAILTLSSECLKFVLNAAHGTTHFQSPSLEEKANASFPLWGFERQTLIHVLNSCSSALNLHRYNEEMRSLMRLLTSPKTIYLKQP